MSEYRTVLERVQRRVQMPEPAMERLLRRRDRRLRNQRISAALVGLGVAVAGIGFGILALRGRQAGRPASGGLPSPGPADGGVVGVVLPTVAIWIALAVLGLTALAIVRLRRFMAASPHERTTGAQPAPGHGPAAAPRTSEKEGVSTMDSREKMGVKIPQAEVPKIRMDEGRASRINRWLVGAVVVLALAVVTLGAGLIVQAGSEETPTEGLADPATVALVDDFLAAQNAMNQDQTTVASTVEDWYLADAILYVPGVPVEVFGSNEGHTMIQRFYEWILDQSPRGIAVERVSSVVQTGDLVTFLVHDVTGLDHAWAILFRDGKIAQHFAAVSEQESPSS